MFKDTGMGASTPRQKELRAMSFEDVSTELENKLYEASRIIEELENAGRIFGNGHHLRQAIARLGAEELRQRWKFEPLVFVRVEHIEGKRFRAIFTDVTFEVTVSEHTDKIRYLEGPDEFWRAVNTRGQGKEPLRTVIKAAFELLQPLPG